PNRCLPGRRGRRPPTGEAVERRNDVREESTSAACDIGFDTRQRIVSCRLKTRSMWTHHTASCASGLRTPEHKTSPAANAFAPGLFTEEPAGTQTQDTRIKERDAPWQSPKE